MSTNHDQKQKWVIPQSAKDEAIAALTNKARILRRDYAKDPSEALETTINEVETALSALECAETYSPPSALPTTAEVRRFMEHWHGQLAFIGQQATPKPDRTWFSIQLSDRFNQVPLLKFHGSFCGNNARADGSDPESLMESMLREIGPEAKAAHIAKLRAQIEELEKEAA